MTSKKEFPPQPAWENVGLLGNNPPLTRRQLLGVACGAYVTSQEVARLFPDRKRAEWLRDRVGLEKITDPVARRRLFVEGLPPEIQPSSTLERELNMPLMLQDPGEDGRGTGQALNSLFLNRGQVESGAPLVLYLPRYNNPIEGLSKYGIEQMAANFPEYPILALDYPEVGRSDELTSLQKQVMKNEKSSREVARTAVRIAKAQGAKSLLIVGLSQGGLVGLEAAILAPKYGLEMKQLVTVSSPGVKQFTSGELFSAAAKEGEYIDVYHSWPYDPRMRREAYLDGPWILDIAEQAYWLTSALDMDPGLIYGQTLLDPQLPSLLHEGMLTNPTMQVTVMNGTADHISPVLENRAMVSFLQADPQMAARVRHIENQGEHHAYMDNGRRFSAYMKAVLI